MTTRREFVGQVSASVVAIGAAPVSLARISVAIAPRVPVVSFFMDQPYLDLTGTAKPYIPPRGLRSGQPLADLPWR